MLPTHNFIMEKKMKKIILALATLGTTFSFIACGDDSSSSVVESSSSTPIEDPDSKSEGVLSCDQKLKKTVDGVTSTLHACGEVSYTDEIKELWDEVCPSEGPYDAIQGTGCPSGEKMICKNSEAGFDIVWYIYDEDAAKKSCEELMAENWGDGSDEDDENSDDESDDLLSCDQKLKTTVDGVTSTLHVCGEASYTDEIKELFDEVCTSEGTYTAIQGTGCASGAKKVCKNVEAGFDIVYYVYDEYSASKSCEDLLAEEFEIGSDKTFEGGDE